LSQTKILLIDWVGTAAHPEPDRHEGVYKVARDLGYELPIKKLITSVYNADYQVSLGAPGLWREGKDETLLLKWWEICLANTGIELSKDATMKITRSLSKWFRNVKWVLYDDVLPTVINLKKKGLSLGLISTLYRGGAGLASYLDVVITPKEAGVDKPDSRIFLLALEQVKLEAEDAVYIGDQYERDVIGAIRAGIRSVLIDR
jgi:HAD superfamily hydrolase (TIGR01509 family)